VGRAELSRRADEILAQLTTEEKIGLLHQWSPGVPRLGIAPFRTGTEALHGAAWLGPATVFPQAVGLGATWDPDLVGAVGAAVGAEVLPPGPPICTCSWTARYGWPRSG
jgi:beta-glucosidase